MRFSFQSQVMSAALQIETSVENGVSQPELEENRNHWQHTAIDSSPKRYTYNIYFPLFGCCHRCDFFVFEWWTQNCRLPCTTSTPIHVNYTFFSSDTSISNTLCYRCSRCLIMSDAVAAASNWVFAFTSTQQHIRQQQNVYFAEL